MRRLTRAIPLLLVLSLTAAGQTTDPPEVLATGLAGHGFTSEVEPISAPLLEKMRASTWHAGCPVAPEDLRQIKLSYLDFHYKWATGILIVHKDVAQEVAELFRKLFYHGFLIEKMAPVEEYNGSDDASMAANNTSAFNCRDVTGQPGKFSNHSWGRAIDINPLTNPYVKGDKVLPPEGRLYLDRTKAFPGSILAGSFAVKEFVKAGWQWGGGWVSPKDYQHFEKPVN
jgi:D-alanyl-D-alanine carboxypeptidase-like protein